MSSRNRPRPRRPSIWSTASLRLAIGFALFFGLGSAALVVGVDYGLMRFAEAEVRDGLSHQLDIMRSDAARLGGDALVRDLNAQPRNRDARRYLLLVQAPGGGVFSNGLTRQAVNDSGFRRNLPTKMRARRWPDQAPDMMVLSGSAADGTFLAIGRDTQHLEEWRRGVRTFTIWSGLTLVGLALLGGLVAGWLFLRRLEAVNQAIARIIAGQESARLPAIGFGREFDDLSSNLNKVLDRQQSAFGALKSLSEGVAHELRAPLTRLRNRLEDIAAAGSNPAARDVATGLALEEADQLNALFEALLALARLESGGARVSREPIDLSLLIEVVRDLYAPSVEEGGGQLSASSSGPALIHGDAGLIQQAVANLIENAIFHGGDQPDISLKTETTGDSVKLTVADRGPGIAAEERENVVRRFYRLNDKAHGGWGLGLPMVAAVAQAHEAQLHLDDNAPGLIVELSFPIDIRK